MKPLDRFEVWFVTGSQDMYGDAALRQVAATAEQLMDADERSRHLASRLHFHC